jgi:hypothetical protein
MSAEQLKRPNPIKMMAALLADAALDYTLPAARLSSWAAAAECCGFPVQQPGVLQADHPGRQRVGHRRDVPQAPSKPELAEAASWEQP